MDFFIQLVPLLIILSVAALVGFLIRRRSLAYTGVAKGSSVRLSTLNGLGGWLVLVVVGQVVSLFRVTKEIIEDTPPTSSLSGEAAIAVYSELALNLAAVALIALTTVAMFRKLQVFPKLWKIQMVMMVLLPLVDAVMVAAILTVPTSKLISAEMIGRAIGLSVGVALWWWYMNVSVRVKNTFVE